MLHYDVNLFHLDQVSNQPQTMTFLPWGTRTLKVEVCSRTKQEPLIIRPRGFDHSQAGQDIFYANADNSKDFKVTWGGGHEQGPYAKSKDTLGMFERCVRLEGGDSKEGDSSYIFFNVRHIGKKLHYKKLPLITLEAYREEKDKPVGGPVSCLPISLSTPAQLSSAPAQIIRLTTSDNTHWGISGDKYLPEYDSRWWPATGITYVAQHERPPLSVCRAGENIGIYWDAKEIAIITARTKTLLDPRFVDIAFELFHFDEQRVALRAWFFWLNKKIDDEDPGLELSILGRHEIPDSERFDFIIWRTGELVLLGCTDLHWREKWFYATGEGIPRATIGMGGRTLAKLVMEKVQFWRGSYHRGISYNPLPYVRRKLNPPGTSASPIYHIQIPGKGTVGHTPVSSNFIQILGKGTQAHPPAFYNLTMPKGETPDLTSSDVREG